MSSNKDEAMKKNGKTRGANEKALEASDGKQPEQRKFIAPTSLEAIEKRITLLLDDIPTVEDAKAMTPNQLDTLEVWARKTSRVLGSFKLLGKFIKPAIYKWASDRSGVAEQNSDLLEVEVLSAEILLTEAAGCSINILYPEYKRVVTKTVATEELALDGEQESDDNKSIATVTTTESSETPTSDSEPAMVLPPSKKRKTVTTEYVFEDQEKDQVDRKMSCDLICENALDKRELMIVALNTVLKAFKDYRKASANDVDSRHSGMMM